MSSSKRLQVKTLIQNEISRLHNIENSCDFENLLKNIKERFDIDNLKPMDDAFIKNEYALSLLEHWLECSIKGYAQHIRLNLDSTAGAGAADIETTLKDEEERLTRLFREGEHLEVEWCCRRAHHLIQNQHDIFQKPSARKQQYLDSLKESCLQLLSPPSISVVHEKDNYKVIQIHGIFITCSRLMDELVQHKRQSPDFEELRIICGSHLIIDCDLDQAVWHGTNIAISTEKLFAAADKDVCWNVSGVSNNHRYERAAENASSSTDDGKPGNNEFYTMNARGVIKVKWPQLSS
jgi:hypothetical protein